MSVKLIQTGNPWNFENRFSIMEVEVERECCVTVLSARTFCDDRSVLRKKKKAF